MLWVVLAKFSRWSLTWIKKIKILIKHQNDPPVSCILRLSYFLYQKCVKLMVHKPKLLNSVTRNPLWWIKKVLWCWTWNASALKLVMGYQSKLASQENIDKIWVYVKHTTWMYKMKNCRRLQLSTMAPHMLVHRCVTREVWL